MSAYQYDEWGQIDADGPHAEYVPPPTYNAVPSVTQPSPSNGRPKETGGEQQEIIIAVMGTTGAGKSRFIKTLTDDASIIEGHSLQSCTQELKAYGVLYEGKRIVFVDTPGFNDTNRKDTAILQDVALWLSAAYRANMRLSGIIYLHRITDNRMEGSALRNLRMFKSLCGPAAMGNVILTTTHWDAVELGRAEARETELRDRFWRGMIERGSTVQRFDGSVESAWGIVMPLLPRQRVVLNIQAQIVDQAMEIAVTDAGQVVNEELISAQRKFQEEARALREEQQHALDEKDKELAQALQEERERAEQKLAEFQHEQRDFLKQQAEEMQRRNKEMDEAISRIRETQTEGIVRTLVKGAVTIAGILGGLPPLAAGSMASMI